MEYLMIAKQDAVTKSLAVKVLFDSSTSIVDAWFRGKWKNIL